MLYHIIRTPTWVLPPRIKAWEAMGQAGDVLKTIQMDEQENFSQETIAKFQSDPEFYRQFVKKIEVEVNNAFPIVRRPSPHTTSRWLTEHARFSQRARSKPLRAERSRNT